MTNNNLKTGTDNQKEQSDFDALVTRWHDLVNLARDMAESGRNSQARQLHQQALALAVELEWDEAELFNLRHLINILDSSDRGKQREERLRQGIAKAIKLEEADTQAWLSYQLAGALWSSNKDEAFSWYESALKAAPFPKDWSAITLYYLTLGSRLKEEKQYEKAVKVYQEAVQRADELGDISESLSFRLKMARAYLELNNFEMAVGQLQSTIKLPEIVDYPKMAVKILEELGDAYFLHGHNAQAIPAFQQALTLSRRLGDDDFQIRLLLKVGRSYRLKSSPFESVNFTSEALQLARNHGNSVQVVEALRDLSKTKMMLGKQEPAVILLQDALDIAHSCENHDLELNCLADLARAYENIGLTIAATKTSIKGLELASNMDRAIAIIDFLSILSTKRQLPSNLEGEIDGLAASTLNNSRQSDYPLALSECLSALGNLYIERNPRKALAYYQELADLVLNEEDIPRFITACGLIASAYTFLDDYGQAIKHLQEGLQELEKRGSTYLTHHIAILSTLAEKYLIVGDQIQSQAHLGQLQTMINGMGWEKLDWETALQVTNLQGDFYFFQEKYQLAENAYRSCLDLLEKQYFTAVTPDVRLKNRTAGRFLSRRLIFSTLRQKNNQSYNKQRAFDYVETVRSRLLLSQLGFTQLRLPRQIPSDLLLEEEVLLSKLRVHFHQSIGEKTDYLRDMTSAWSRLQFVWQQMESYGNNAQEFVHQRRGTAIDFRELKACITLS